LLEPADSRVFSVVNNTAHGALRLNLIGREPAGKVAPGADYERLLDTLSEDFSAVVNVETGRPVVNAIYRCDELYPGPERPHLPDLFIDWTNEAPVRAVASNRMPTVEGAYRYVRSGEDRPDGIYVICGRDIQSGSQAPTVRCMDFAPTFAGLLDVSLADGIDGRPIALHAAMA
jgi:predicted AlkP superfamily phosphohydrolase/phosphomutase